jgi:hypothetical protein
MIKRRNEKRQTIDDKTLHIRIRIVNTNPTETMGELMRGSVHATLVAPVVLIMLQTRY